MIEKMQEILRKDEGGTPVFNTYAVEIGGVLWEAIYEYIYKEFGLDEDYQLIYTIEGIYEDDNQKFAILRNRKDLTYYRLNFLLSEEEGFLPAEALVQVSPDFKPTEVAQFALEDVAAYEATFVESKKEKVKDPEPAVDTEFSAVEEPVAEVQESNEVQDKTELVTETSFTEEATNEVEVAEAVKEESVAEFSNEQETASVVEEPNKYNLDEVVEYQELLEKYSTLEG
jgi:hypothetical protein